MISRRSELEDESNKKEEEEDEESIDSPFYRAIFKVNKKIFFLIKSHLIVVKGKKLKLIITILKTLPKLLGRSLHTNFPKK